MRRCTSSALSVATLLAALWTSPPAPESVEAAAETIVADDLTADLLALASAPLEGRDSPSAGLSRAAEHITARLTAAGYEGVGADGSFLVPFSMRVWAPVESSCGLALQGGEAFEYGADYVPYAGATGDAEGPLTFLGYGVSARKAKYDDFKRQDVRDRIVVFAEGEPRHPKKFDGPVVTAVADLDDKLALLEEERAAGALVIRRPPPAVDGAPEAAALSFRHTRASWAGVKPNPRHDVSFPVLEIDLATASRLIGQDVGALLEEIDASVKPNSFDVDAVVTMSSATTIRDVTVHNVVGKLTGSDQELAAEHVVIGAHYDHVGVDELGRIGYGADDNASGTSAMLEVAEALAATAPRRSVLACAFAAEEDGLLGSAALVARPPVPIDSMVAMLNMDMVGRGKAKEVVVLGARRNPDLDKLLGKAKKAVRTGVTKIVTGKGEELFQRSDHYSFHRAGVPALFFFEGVPISKNEDYHTWRDTIDRVDVEKIANTARLVFATAWLLCDDDGRPDPPKS